MPYRTFVKNQRAQVWIGGPGLDQPELVFETDEILIEAPNWALDGTYLVLNGHGGLWRLPLDSDDKTLSRIDFVDLPELNNDHVLDPDGRHIYLSAADRLIYRASLAGGAVEAVTPQDGRWHFLHGVSPDGSRLAYVEIDTFDQPGRLAVCTVGGAVEIIDTGDGHMDGPEWSPDGQWIYLNTEAFTSEPGHAQLARLPERGGPLQQLVKSDTVDWFPHLSPDGRLASYIAFPAGTLGHPANRDVEVRVVDVTNWARPLQRYPLSGGQGTINVNSWAPDSSRFAFVSYPIG